MLNRYPLWKYLLMLIILLIGVLYALPNLFGDDYAVQVSGRDEANVSSTLLNNVEQALKTQQIPYSHAELEKNSLLIRFPSLALQRKAQDIISAAVGDNYIVALNLAPKTPAWLEAIGAHPMEYGLDLRGGVHFLLEVDVASAIKMRQVGDIRGMGADLRQANIRYRGIERRPPHSLIIRFENADNRNEAHGDLSNKYPDYSFINSERNNVYFITATLMPRAINNINQYIIEQTITTLKNRVNELGVSDASVQQQGRNQIGVDLPGIQDTARAQSIIGKMATIRLQLVDTTHDLKAAEAGNVPFGTKLYTYEGRSYLLKNQVILRGSSITYATSTVDQQTGGPAVNVRLGGGGESLFRRITAENVGKPLATIYVETRPITKMVDGKPVKTRQTSERLINVATINGPLGNNFVITGLSSMQEAQNLALLLRSGAYQAQVSIIQSRVIGPSLGQANIERGVLSTEIGAILVILFMIFYYRLFGIIADIALVLNVVFIVAVLSIVGATLTLPGIAGIVLTMGMAVDANVLINERIREELRHGLSPQKSIHAGYERAFSTIIDANVTTLIVAIILFALGSGPVKGFAITLTIGLLTSMVTAVFFTRGIVNLIYGGRPVKKLSIGIKIKSWNERKKTIGEN